MIRQDEQSVIRFCKICFIILLTAGCLYFLIYQLVEKPIDLDTTNATVLTDLKRRTGTGKNSP